MNNSPTEFKSVTITGARTKSLLDRAFGALVLALAGVLGALFLAAGLFFSFRQTTKIGSVGGALLGSAFMTLGTSCAYAILAVIFPTSRAFADRAEARFRKLLVLTPILFLVFFVILILF